MTKEIIIGVLAVAVVILGIEFAQTNQKLTKLVDIDNRKIAVDMKAMTACVNGWSGSIDGNPSAVASATADLNSARKTNIDVNKERKDLLGK